VRWTYRALAGAVAGVAAVGAGLLAAAGLRVGLGVAPSGPPAPGPRAWLAGTLLGTADPAPGTAAVAVAVVLVGAVAGTACRSRLRPGLAVLAAAGAVAAWIVVSPGAPPAAPVVPLAATVAAMATLTALLRPRAVPDPAPGPQLSRRRALVTGLLVTTGTVAGLVVSSGRRPPGVPLRAAGGTPRLGPGPVVDVRDLGAAGDGRTDDGDPIRRGMAQVNRTGGTLFFPAGTYYYRATGPLRPAGGVRLAGAPGASTIAFDSPAAAAFVDFCVVDAAGVTVDGLIVRRVAEFPAVLLNLGAATGFAFTRGALVGNIDALPGADCHGVKFPDGGTAGPITLADSTFATLTYGLLQANASTAVVAGVTVQRCSFAHNAGTDLEFNSPYGSIRQVRVEGCAFSDNDSAGFGVGLAHVAGAEVLANTFDRYALEAVHVEDYSTDVTVQDNTFTACGLRDHSHVQIISGSQRVRVVGNTFRATGNTRPIYVVDALPGGDHPTAGARPPGPPSAVTVEDNTFDCVEPAVPVYFQGVRDGVIRANTVTATGDPFRLLDDPGTVIAANTVNPRR
jgi:parallel beta helix pectate lyase-like protein/pectate lyase-like protein